jgi:hypothetical protein
MGMHAYPPKIEMSEILTSLTNGLYAVPTIVGACLSLVGGFFILGAYRPAARNGSAARRSYEPR